MRLMTKKCRGVLFLCSLLFTSALYAQSVDTNVIARLMLVQKNIGVYKKPVAVVSLTFINTSDSDIYIPAIFAIDRSLNGGKVKTYVKAKGVYQSDGDYGRPIPNTQLGKSLGNPISGSSNELVNKYLFVGTEKVEKQNKILSEFTKKTNISLDSADKKKYNRFKAYAAANHIALNTLLKYDLQPLFLKAHEEFEIAYIKDVDKLINIPNEYKVTYVFDYALVNAQDFPTKILTYKRFIPKNIASNTLYVKVEP